MHVNDTLRKRRTIYQINKELTVSESQLLDSLKETVELVPDAFNMKSQRIVVALGAKQDELWDRIYDAFDGKVAREKIDGFKAAAGTVLYFYDESIVKNYQEQFPLYAHNFPIWVQQSNGMLQLAIWTSLREMGMGANLQHYNPIIDAAVKKLFHVPESYVLLAQMPFGGIVAEADAKEKEDINQRVAVFKD